MNERLTGWLERWKGLPSSRKSIIAVMVIAIMLAGFFLILETTKEEYSPLFTGLDPKTANAVVENLKQSGIRHRLEAEGTAIMVPKKQVYDIRIQLAGEGLLTNTGLGFELFDQSKLGVTEFERRLDFLRALQEELRRTIVQLKEVEQARVHLVLPEKSVFVKEDRPASAAVTISLKPLAKLNPEQIKGIIYLVSSSVDNLPPDNVKIIDQSGFVLSDGVLLADSESLTYQNMAQYEMRRSLEKDLERRVENMLERVLGLDRVVAMVTADLNFEKRQEVSVEYGEGSILSQETIQEESQSSGGSQGVAGIEGNIGVPYYPSGGQENETYTRNENITNYLVDQTERTTVQSPGQIRRLSTAVVINGLFDEEEMDRIRSIIQTAVGYDFTRGDQIIVENMFFAGVPEIEPPVEEAPPEELTLPLWQLIAIGVGAFVLLLTLLFVFLRRRKKTKTTDGFAELIEDRPLEPIPLSKVVPEISIEERIRIEKQKKLVDIVKEKPEDAVLLLRAWISDE